MADNTTSKVLTLGALAVAAYFVYEWFFVTPAAATTTTTTTTPASTTTTSSTTSTASTGTTAAATMSLASLYSALVAACTAANDPAIQNNGETLTSNPNVFNTYMARILPNAPAGYTGVDWPPNTTTVFGANQNAPITITAYWTAMSAYLSQYAGMSGLGVFVGLGQLARMGRSGMGKYEAVPNQFSGWPEVAWPGGAGRPVQ
jgi:hypothetical protein